MAPRDTTKTTPRPQRPISKINTTKKPIIPASCFKKAMSTNNIVEKTPQKVKNASDIRTRTNTAPILATPKSKENKPAPIPNSVTKSGKKNWKRKPKPAHSGVPVPEKMKKLLGKRLQEMDCSF